jgi:hypothetical protein
MMGFLKSLFRKRVPLEREPDDERFPEPEIRAVWRSDWNTSDGFIEYQTLVGKSSEGYHPGLSLSQYNREPRTSWGDAYQSEARARDEAWKMLEGWERGISIKPDKAIENNGPLQDGPRQGY